MRSWNKQNEPIVFTEQRESTSASVHLFEGAIETSRLLTDPDFHHHNFVKLWKCCAIFGRSLEKKLSVMVSEIADISSEECINYNVETANESDCKKNEFRCSFVLVSLADISFYQIKDSQNGRFVILRTNVVNLDLNETVINIKNVQRVDFRDEHSINRVSN